LTHVLITSQHLFTSSVCGWSTPGLQKVQRKDPPLQVDTPPLDSSKQLSPGSWPGACSLWSRRARQDAGRVLALCGCGAAAGPGRSGLPCRAGRDGQSAEFCVGRRVPSSALCLCRITSASTTAQSSGRHRPDLWAVRGSSACWSREDINRSCRMLWGLGACLPPPLPDGGEGEGCVSRRTRDEGE